MLPASRSFIGRTKGGRGVISRTPLWETLGSVDNYLSSFSRRGVVQERRLRQPGRRSHRSFSAPPSSFSSSLSFLHPSFPPPSFLLSLSSSSRLGRRRGNSSFFCSSILSLLLSPLSAPSSLLFFSFLFPLCSSFLLLSSLSSCSPFLPLLLFLPQCSSFLLPFFPLPSEFRRPWLYSFPPPNFSESSVRRSHSYIDDC